MLNDDEKRATVAQLNSEYEEHKFDYIFDDILFTYKSEAHSMSIYVSACNSVEEAVKLVSNIVESKTMHRKMNSFITEERLDMPKAHGKPVERPEQVMEPIDEITSSSINNGGSTDYYKLPENTTNAQDIIEWREMNYSQGNMFKVAFTFNSSRHIGTNYERDLNKLIYFANRELSRISDD